MKKILFVCTQNQVRSLTAEHLFNGRNGCQTASAGTSGVARVKLTENLIRWADLVVYMDSNHQEFGEEVFPEALAEKRTVCLRIPDLYYYGETELKNILEDRMKPYFQR